MMKVTLQRNKSFRRMFSKIPKEGNQGNGNFPQGHCQAGSSHPWLRWLWLCPDSCWELDALGWFSLPWHVHTHTHTSSMPCPLAISGTSAFCMGPGSQTIGHCLQKYATKSLVLFSSLFPLHQTSRSMHVPCQVTQ